MKRLLVCLICLMISAGPLSPLAAGGQCGVRTNVARTWTVRTQHADQVKFVTPYAVALGVPVAVYPGVSYSYNSNAYNAGAAYSGATATNSAQLKAAIQEAVKAALQELQQGGDVSALAASPSLLQQNCLACHQGEAASGQFRVDQPLSDSDRLRATQQVLSGSMPRGKTLTDQARGNLLGEIVGLKPQD